MNISTFFYKILREVFIIIFGLPISIYGQDIVRNRPVADIYAPMSFMSFPHSNINELLSQANISLARSNPFYVNFGLGVGLTQNKFRVGVETTINLLATHQSKPTLVVHESGSRSLSLHLSYKILDKSYFLKPILGIGIMQRFIYIERKINPIPNLNALIQQGNQASSSILSQYNFYQLGLEGGQNFGNASINFGLGYCISQDSKWSDVFRSSGGLADNLSFIYFSTSFMLSF